MFLIIQIHSPSYIYAVELKSFVSFHVYILPFQKSLVIKHWGCRNQPDDTCTRLCHLAAGVVAADIGQFASLLSFFPFQNVCLFA